LFSGRQLSGGLLKKVELRLGQILAYLQSERGQKILNRMKPSETSENLIRRLHRKMNGNTECFDFPDPDKHSGSEYRQYLEDYFVTILLSKHAAQPDSGHCDQLYRLLNDSYPAFRDFAGVIEDYSEAVRTLAEQRRGRK
jgi:hypothetical protein